MRMKVDEKLEAPNATMEELDRIERVKAEKSDVKMLREEVERLEEMMMDLDDEYEGDYEDYDDDSENEDVISLGEVGLSNTNQNNNEEEGDEEEFLDTSPKDKETNQAIADKAKDLANKSLTQSAAFEPSAKLGEKEKDLNVNTDLPEEEEKKQPFRKKSHVAKDLKSPLDKPEEKKSEPSNPIDCAETNHSLGQTLKNFNNSTMKKEKIRMQSTMRSRGGKLSRVTSKMSIATRKMKGVRRGGNSKEVNELKLNMRKVLEDVKRLKSFENESAGTFRRFENTLVDLKKKNDLFSFQNNKIIKRQQEMEQEHSGALDAIKNETSKVIKIHKEIKKMITNFKAEYRYGFKKIIKAEVDINFLMQQLKFIKTRIKPKDDEKIDKNKLLGEIDSKFEVLYGQVSEMASEQAHFNSNIQKEQEHLKEPIKNEITKIREESNIMMRELERTQINNREILTSRLNTSMVLDDPKTPLPRKKMRHSTPLNNSSNSMKLRKFNISAQKNPDADFSNIVVSKSTFKATMGKSIKLKRFTPSLRVYRRDSSVDKRLRKLEEERKKIGTTLSTPKYNRFRSSGR